MANGKLCATIGSYPLIRTLPGVPQVGLLLRREAAISNILCGRNIMHPNLAISFTVAASLAFTLATPALAKECYAPDARAQERAFSRAVTTEGGKTVWLGGQTGSPEKNFEGQVRDIFAELDKTLKAVGGAGLKDMVTMTVFINDVRLGDRLTEIRKEIFKEGFPGSARITRT